MATAERAEAPSWVTEWYANDPVGARLAIVRFNTPVTTAAERAQANSRFINPRSAIGALMNVPTLDVPLEVAQERRDEYRAYCADHPDDAEARDILRALTLCAVGTKLLSLRAAFEAVELDAYQRPKLAIARADRLLVRLRVRFQGFNFDSNPGRGRRGRDLEIDVESPIASMNARDGWALLPVIPPMLEGLDARRFRRPSTEKLAYHYILWEVEEWVSNQSELDGDRDPYLLTRVTRDLFAIVAAWDVTDAERFAAREHRVPR